MEECLEELEGSSNYLDVKDIYGTIHRIPIDDITHISRKKEDRRLHIYCLDNKEIIISQTLESIGNRLSDNKNITKSGKSCLVNINNIEKIIKNVIIFLNDNKEEASRRCLPELINKLKIK